LVKLYTDNESAIIKKWMNNSDDKRSAIETHNQTLPKENQYFNNAPLPPENPKYQDINGNLDMKVMAKSLNEALAMRTESLAIHLLGEPNKSKSSKDYLTFGSGKSALKVTLTGQNRGYFKDWTTGEKGSGINLIMATENIGFKAALTYADKLINQPQETALSVNEKHEKLINTTPKMISELEARARQYQQESTPLKGTLAQQYLHQKGINIEAHPTITFHPKVYSSETRMTHPAMISKIENAQGESKAIEITYLDDKGNAAELNINKRILGTKTGANIHVNEGTNTNISIITNTVEDALLINQHNPKDIDINTVNNKNDIQGIDQNTLRENVIIVLDTKGETLNENNITKIMDNLKHKNVIFIDNNEMLQQIQNEITKVDNGLSITSNDLIKQPDIDQMSKAIRSEDENIISTQLNYMKEQERKEEGALLTRSNHLREEDKMQSELSHRNEKTFEIEREM
jgi:cob(I)alamin adenosyltransferase